VNNAGLTGGGAFLGGDPETLDRFYRINVRGPFLLTQLVAPIMVDTGGGTIVNISSGAAIPPAAPTPGGVNQARAGAGVVYGMSKAALDRFSAGIAVDLVDKGIAVITIHPGYTITERSRGADPSRGEKPETTGKAVAFLCRDAMAYTGRIFRSREVVDQNGLE
jgi:NAD(P)-dependent dehydrogenase (short-subunit alcohol dehydrogenase family)